MQATPNGVQAMSADMPGLVQTSLNLGILKADAEVLRAEYSVRSSVESEKDNLIAKLSALVELTGGDYVVTGDYPGRSTAPILHCGKNGEAVCGNVRH